EDENWILMTPVRSYNLLPVSYQGVNILSSYKWVNAAMFCERTDALRVHYCLINHFFFHIHLNNYNTATVNLRVLSDRWMKFSMENVMFVLHHIKILSTLLMPVPGFRFTKLNRNCYNQSGYSTVDFTRNTDMTNTLFLQSELTSDITITNKHKSEDIHHIHPSKICYTQEKIPKVVVQKIPQIEIGSFIAETASSYDKEFQSRNQDGSTSSNKEQFQTECNPSYVDENFYGIDANIIECILDYERKIMKKQDMKKWKIIWASCLHVPTISASR
ncbi:hypothetical protein L9F63_018234, partial [Diploptera punctata]